MFIPIGIDEVRHRDLPHESFRLSQCEICGKAGSDVHGIEQARDPESTETERIEVRTPGHDHVISKEGTMLMQCGRPGEITGVTGEALSKS